MNVSMDPGKKGSVIDQDNPENKIAFILGQKKKNYFLIINLINQENVHTLEAIEN